MFFANKIKLALLAGFIFLFAGCGHHAQPVRSSISFFRNTDAEHNLLLSSAKVLIEKTDGNGSTCSAFPYDLRKGKYLFVTSAHCVAKFDVGKEKIKIKAESIYLHFEFNNFLKENLFRAKIVAVGYKPIGDDFAILEAKIPMIIPVLYLSEKKAKIGEYILNVGYPKEARGHIFYGMVKHFGKIKYQTSFMVGGIKNGKGASGSAVMSVSSGRVLGILSSQLPIETGLELIFINADKFRKFEKRVMDGKYPYFKK
ncbi:MAG: hypothetical protein A2469_01890 [Candidatus Magasanikbacteria bacterium RIFOXYC2_FULL_40_16]|uniref:Peptidase S1 domain-containing protein n=2 Tax=Candidatus Magasanikiibacteriota TaxID=1752731 RepID=A0A1F6NJI6_9BACT|nr:MAG: hypothetical protein A2224_01860 [Candidatus Magasanikbacteria bacterium RIFOXYA2_FULL_40_20]OGH83995.1 MAG: hypothetical protein A2373_01330 [Candidatus Magasanikbacteria bacterium RIFOXYB1_FULL_40_15]OGH85536.1 MAG: hypothetical protein A2301_01915 [Candidatus Magasanikbacteria bacterium RIFOXYB2_FULL_40_13]OGH90120.1 MAG: hypothetical protein A2469_01890 [Candidatus Magasanikbacteria bacterium RIFOXYC2_FULL_40_16]